nr:hypothetical protein [uncultured Bacillus sp.]
MQISNGLNIESFNIKEQTASPFKQGEVSSLLIKQKLGDHEAIAVIKGEEIQVCFEGKPPAGEQVQVVIGRMNEQGILTVRPVTHQPSEKANVIDSLTAMLTNAGFPPEKNGDLLAAAKFAAANGAIINEEIITNLQYFLTNESGTLAEKLKTIEAMLQKKLELSVSQLHAVHAALNGENTAEILMRLLQNLGLELKLDVKPALSEKEFLAVQQTLEGKGDLQHAVENWLSSIEPSISIENAGSIQLQNNEPATDLYAAVDTHSLQSKKFIVTEITKKLLQLSSNFKKEQREMNSTFEQIINSTDSKVNRETVKQTLETTINKLNHTILKSEVMLYADMATEKNLLRASSRLAEARKLIEEGKMAEAKTIVREVKTAIENIQFKPANVKMQHFTEELFTQHSSVNEGVSRQQNIPKQPIISQILQSVTELQAQESNARQISERIRALGLTYELDTANQLLNSKQEVQEQQANLKVAMLKLMQHEEGQTRSIQVVEQTLAHLTGQQLLNKSDATGMQQLFLQLPLLLNKKMENIKVYISSEKKGEKLDWENCSLYFVLETKKMGEVGIMVNVQNRQLNLTFKNDEELFREKMEPLTGETLERLQEIGFNTGAIQYGTLHTNEVPNKETQAIEEKEASINNSNSLEKGFDFSV